MVLNDCHRCHVLLDGGKKKLEGRVVHTKKDVKIYFNVTTLRDARVKLPVIFFDDQQGVLSGICELLFRRNPLYGKDKELWMAECKILDLNRSENNQRKAVRIKTNLEVAFQSSNHGGFYGTICDLSVGGLRLLTRQILDRNERITFTYSFAAQPRKYEAIVIRGVRDLEGKFSYGCRFVKLTDAAESAIGGWLFKKQQEMRNGQ